MNDETRNRNVETEPKALIAQLKELAQKANNGDYDALNELRQLCVEHPEILNHIADLAKLAEAVWIDLATHADVLLKENATREVAKLKLELCGKQPTAMERLLVDDVVLCYVALRHAELLAAQTSPTSVSVARLRLQRLESAQRRFQTACKTLAAMRTFLSRGMVPLDSIRVFSPKSERA
jgi:hypothetical protein